MLSRFRLLLTPDPPEGGAPQPNPTGGTPPPAATTVVNAEVTEEMARLRAERETLSNRTRQLETDVASLQDENRRLKTPPTPTPTPNREVPADDRSHMEKWLAGEA